MSRYSQPRALQSARFPARMPGLAVVLAAIAAVSLAGCTRPLTYAHDVKPILDQNCIQCHQPGGVGFERSGLDLRTYEGLMKGTRFGQVVIPGDSMDSVLIELVQHRSAPEIHMPYQHTKLADKDLNTLEKWVDQGAKP